MYDRNGTVESTTDFNLSSQILGTYFATRIYNNSVYTRTDVQYTFRDYVFNMPFATSAKFIYIATVSKSSTTKYIVNAMDFNIVNGNIIIPTTLLDDIKQTAIEATGYSPTSTEYDFSISLRETFLIVDFDFPASLNGLNWNWRP